MKQHQLILTLPLKEVRCKLRYELRWGALRGQIKAQIPLAEGGEVLWIQPDQQPPLLLILQHWKHHCRLQICEEPHSRWALQLNELFLAWQVPASAL